jgi:hypothetical protein
VRVHFFRASATSSLLFHPARPKLSKPSIFLQRRFLFIFPQTIFLFFFFILMKLITMKVTAPSKVLSTSQSLRLRPRSKHAHSHISSQNSQLSHKILVPDMARLDDHRRSSTAMPSFSLSPRYSFRVPGSAFDKVKTETQKERTDLCDDTHRCPEFQSYYHHLNNNKRSESSMFQTPAQRTERLYEMIPPRLPLTTSGKPPSFLYLDHCDVSDKLALPFM